MDLKHVTVCVAVVCMSILTGCATRNDVKRLNDDLLYIRVHLDALQSENRKMLALLQNLDTTVADLADENARAKADLIAEMTSLRESSQYLQGLLDDTGDRMSRLLHKVEDRGTSSRTIADSVAADLLSPTGARPDAVPGGDLDATELYNAAYLDLSRSDYDLALRGFREYLKIFPNSDFADNSQYWIGEIYYAKGEYERSFNEFKKVPETYSKGDKAAASLLKMGYCLIHLDDKQAARRYLNEVINKFPNSQESRLAQSRLEELSPSP